MKYRFVALKPYNNKLFFNNRIFNKKYEIGSPYFNIIKKILLKKNVRINTIDVPVTGEIDKYVYLDVPYPWELMLWLKILIHKEKNILYILEPPIVNPFNFLKLLHRLFMKVYIWNSDYVDNKKYFKYYMAKMKTGLNTKKIDFKKKKLLTMMNINWLPFLPFRVLSLSTKELYTERIKAINFFNNFPDDFSLYGRGWNKAQKFSLKQRIFGYKKYDTYKGEFLAKEKLKILSCYKFCLCFENTDNPGNISEKIFDCFKAKCIPIYKGAKDIKKYIPSSCFINGWRFKNYNELYDYLTNMTEKEYDTYINSSLKLMANKKFQERWFEDGFAKYFIKSLDL